ncbi:MAG: hypothetical protein J0H80_01840 [Rhizobiales bacterium]|nr:hypothetical protein [Hyphomicrobiales bacterium]
MSASPSFTLYNYSPELQPVEPCCRDDGLGDAFFGSAKTVPVVAIERRDAFPHEQGHASLPVRLEQIETVPPAKDVILALVNDGAGAIVKGHDIIQTIGRE